MNIQESLQKFSASLHWPAADCLSLYGQAFTTDERREGERWADLYETKEPIIIFMTDHYKWFKLFKKFLFCKAY